MKFGTRYEEAARKATNSSNKWVKGFKEGDTRLRFLQEMKDWIVYYEHYNPAGTYFPCTGDKTTCPGCTSTNERMKQATRKTAANALVGQYVDVYKMPSRLVNRLAKRAERNDNTITDRDYIITRIGMDQSTEYDAESGNAAPIDISAYELIDIDALLTEQFRENFPDFEADQFMADAEAKLDPATKSTKASNGKPTIKEAVNGSPTDAVVDQDPPSEPVAQQHPGQQEGQQEDEIEISLDQLNAMDEPALRSLCHTSGVDVPDDLHGTPAIVDWMTKQFA